ncbi:MAG TPA: septum formation initiator family protein [Acidobacteriota bacterium]|nr:septum formation initiator family protein [Acidobacteriota bacterium]
MALSKRARRHLSWIVMILVGLGSAVFMVFADGGLLSLRETQSDMESLQQENQDLQRRRQEYLDRIEALKNDPKEKERVIRGQKYAKPNEIIINIPEKEQQHDPPPEP